MRQETEALNAMVETVDVLGVLRIERHRLGPRFYLLGLRVHECHLGLVVLSVLGLGAIGGVVHNSLSTVIAVAVGGWMVVKDWRDLMASKRDTACWRLGLHRRAVPLREIRRADFLPTLAAFVAAGTGLLNLLSALTPNSGWRNALLAGVEPLKAVPVFHAVALPAAACLLACALFLHRRRRRAWQVAFVLMLSLGVVNLLKGLDVEEAGASFAAAALLWWGRDAFYVRHDAAGVRSALRRVPALLAGAIMLAGVSVWIAAPAGASFSLVVRETLDLLLWRAGPVSFRDEVGDLPLGVELISLTALFACASLVFRPLATSRILPGPELRRAAAELVRSHGADTLAFFKLRADQHYLFSADGRAFLGYRVENRVMLLAGDPVGPPEALPELIREACAFAERHGLKLGAVGVGESFLPVYAEAGLRSLYLGDEAILDTRSFSLEGRPIRKVRQSVSRLEKASFAASLHELDELDEQALSELERVSAAWREGLRERGFSMAMDSLRGDQRSGEVVVVARDEHGAIRGFLHFVPSFGRAAMSLSAMRREKETPNGLMEFLVVKSIELLRIRGVEEVSLNFAIFARLMHAPGTKSEWLLGRLIALANPYFQIESLYRFNAKFFPHWQPRYLLYEGVLDLPRVGVAALWAEGQLPRPATPRLPRLRRLAPSS